MAAGEGAPIGALAVRIGADASQLISELTRGNKALEKHKDAYELAGRAGAVFATALASVATGLAVATKMSINSADAMFKAAQAAGMATSSFSEYAYAAGLSGVSTEQLSVSLNKFNKGIIDAANFTGDAAKAFQALGIEARNTDGTIRSADELMMAVADRFANIQDGAGKSALALELFGRSGAQMIPMLNNGSAGLKAMREEARLLGVSIDSEAGRAAEEFNDQITRLGAVTRGYANALMMELLPALNQIADALVTNRKESGGLNTEIKALADFLMDTGVAAFQVIGVTAANVAFVFKTLGMELGGWMAQIAALSRLDFQGFSAISTAMKEDAARARSELDALEKRIMGFKLTKPTQDGGAMDMGVGLKDTFFGKERAPEIEKGDDLVSKQLAEGLEEEIRVQMEAYAATVKYADMKRAAEKAALDDRNKAMMDFFDLQQELEIKRGEETLKADGVSQTEKLRLLRETMISEETLEQERYDKRLEQLKNFSDAELETLGGRQQVEQKMEADHQAKILSIRSRSLNDLSAFSRASWQQQTTTLIGMLDQQTAGVANSSREMFEINKALATANAIIKGIEATQSAFAYGSLYGGVYAGAAMAAIAAAIAAANVVAIQGQTFRGGGGGGGGVAPTYASTPAPAVTPVGGSGGGSDRQRGPDTIIHLHGDSFDRKSVRNLINSLNEEGRDGGRIVLAGNQ